DFPGAVLIVVELHGHDGRVFVRWRRIREPDVDGLLEGQAVRRELGGEADELHAVHRLRELLDLVGAEVLDLQLRVLLERAARNEQRRVRSSQLAALLSERGRYLGRGRRTALAALATYTIRPRRIALTGHEESPEQERSRTKNETGSRHDTSTRTQRESERSTMEMPKAHGAFWQAAGHAVQTKSRRRRGEWARAGVQYARLTVRADEEAENQPAIFLQRSMTLFE